MIILEYINKKKFFFLRSNYSILSLSNRYYFDSIFLIFIHELAIAQKWMQLSDSCRNEKPHIECSWRSRGDTDRLSTKVKQNCWEIAVVGRISYVTNISSFLHQSLFITDSSIIQCIEQQYSPRSWQLNRKSKGENLYNASPCPE